MEARADKRTMAERLPSGVAEEILDAMKIYVETNQELGCYTPGQLKALDDLIHDIGQWLTGVPDLDPEVLTGHRWPPLKKKQTRRKT